MDPKGYLGVRMTEDGSDDQSSWVPRWGQVIARLPVDPALANDVVAVMWSTVKS